jgi:hypothetical protein
LYQTFSAASNILSLTPFEIGYLKKSPIIFSKTVQFTSTTLYRRSSWKYGQSIAEVENRQVNCHRKSSMGLDVISIGKLVRKNDGPEVEQIL